MENTRMLWYNEFADLKRVAFPPHPDLRRTAGDMKFDNLSTRFLSTTQMTLGPIDEAQEEEKMPWSISR